MSRTVKVGLALTATLFVMGGATAYLRPLAAARALNALRGLRASAFPGPGAPSPTPPAPVAWDGIVEVGSAEERATGITVAPVRDQDQPIELELNGRTAYDPDSITKVRPRFDTRVEKVFASIGARVRKGAPLVELYSTDLAAAKTDFQTKFVQWQHDLKLLETRSKLAATGAVALQLLVDTQNSERKGRLEFDIAHDKLAVFYEVPKAEIDPLLVHLGDKTVDFQSFGNVSDKAKMTIKAKSDGYVIARGVVPGNYYETTDVLMEIAPLDHLWVWVNVFEVDQDKVRVGQSMEIHFPYLEREVTGTVDYVASQVSRETRAVQARALIPNPENRFKSDMLVKATLRGPPVKGQTVVPRQAMVTNNGKEFVFVRSAGPATSSRDRFERRPILVAQENADMVVVESGLSSGEEVATRGSLVLAELFEQAQVSATGLGSE